MPHACPGTVDLIAKEDGIVAGLAVYARVFTLLDPGAKVEFFCRDGDTVQPGQKLAVVTGDIRALLSGERVALNYLQRMSGIATYTHQLSTLLEGTGITLLDTRKTSPNNRIFEKYAVRVGGGSNHRTGLSDGVLLKDNHIGAAGGVAYQLFDSFYLLFLTLLISVPVSLGAAVFLTEYAPEGPAARIASTAIETLSSLPSIVVGMFGFLVFSVSFGWKYSIISGAVALTMFNIPILVRVIQQALTDVPQDQRDACLAMGLTRWEATVHVLIPAAMPAIVTGVVLSAGRVFGEAAALLFTSGMSSPVRLNFATLNFASPTCAWNVFRPGESLAVHIYKIYGEGSPEAQQIVWGTAALLMICVLLFNVASRVAGKALAKRMTAE